tara:strand:- start:168 stop:1355 length:1188 start_codon:yes stop_codon:yes gene_type:complete
MLLTMLVLMAGAVSAISCEEADYDGDGDVDFMDVFQLRQCINISVSEVTAVNCSFFDYDDSGMVEENDLVKYREWNLKTCPVVIECEDSDGEDYYVNGFIYDKNNGAIFSESGSGSDTRVISEWKAELKINEEWIDVELDGIYTLSMGKFKIVEIDEALGKVTLDYLQLSDGCQGDTTLFERTCDRLGNSDYVYYECPDGCSDGACVVESNETEANVTMVCTDSDGGKAIYERGLIRVVGDSGTDEEEDLCWTDSDGTRMLTEFYCKEDGSGATKKYACSYGCEDGVCVKGNETEGEDEGEDEINDSDDNSDGVIEMAGCNGCLLDDKCFNFGYRKAIDRDLKYCFESGNWTEQKSSEESCGNSFECDSNLCVDSECVSAGFFKRIMNWFSRWFS